MSAVIILLIAVSLSFGWHYFNDNENIICDSSLLITQDFSAHFIDVGQGDCELIFDNNRTVLIDGGEFEKGNEVVKYLKSLGIEKIDILIATHPHTDHIGGLTAVVKNFEVGRLIIPDIPSRLIPTTNTYTNFLKLICEKNVNVDKAEVGKSYKVGLGNLTILGPANKGYLSLNSWSVALRYVYKNTSFLMCGDMEKDAEQDLINSGQDIKSDVFKLNHHGSKTSNTKEFLKAVAAKIYIIEVGSGNSYGHPSIEVIKRLGNSKIYRTDLNGTIVISTDGDELSVKSKKGSDSSVYFN